MWLLPVAFAADVPSVAEPIDTGNRAGRDAALVLSVEAYDQLPPATYAAADAALFRAILEDSVGLSSYRLRGGDQLDGEALARELRRAAARVRRGGTLWIYAAGHGATIEGQPWLLARDATLDEPTGIALRELVERAAATRAGRVIVVVDAGFGPLGRGGHELNAEAAGDLPEAEEQVSLWLATRDEQPLLMHAAGHGAFTWTLAGALRGWADGLEGGGRDGEVTLGEAQTWQRETLRALGMVLTPTSEARELREQALVSGVDEAGPDALTLSALAVGAREMRILQAQDRLRERAAAGWRAIEQARADGDPEARARAEAFVAAYQRPVLTVEWTTYLPQVSLAEGALETWEIPEVIEEEEVQEEEGVVEEEVVEEPPAVAEVAPVEEEPEEALDDSCDQLSALEDPAMKGTLRPGQIACLEERIEASDAQTEQDRISRVLLANAAASGDDQALGWLLRRHLDEITRSDPDLCLRYALHLSEEGVEHADEVVRWVDVALENKLVWHGAQYTSRVNDLLALKAKVAAQAWRDANAAFMAERNQDNAAVAEAARNDAKQFAREWLDFVRSAELDEGPAARLCAETAGTKRFCDE